MVRERSTVQSCPAAPVIHTKDQQPVEALEVFASLLIHGSAASMVLRMASPTKRKGSNNHYFRKNIPADVKRILARLPRERRPRCWYRDTIWISLRTPDPALAKARWIEVAADLEHSSRRSAKDRSHSRPSRSRLCRALPTELSPRVSRITPA